MNADDFGLSPRVNAGVAAAHSEGILTSASIMANAPAFREAAEFSLAHPRLGVGVHLNLVRGKPLSKPEAVPSLVDGGGRLRHFRWRRQSAAFLRDAETEYRRQLERVLAAGIRPTHVDFEKHHAWPGRLYALACRLAGEYGIPAARNLREPVWWSFRALGWPGWKRLAMAAALRTGAATGRARAGTAVPDRLLGQLHMGGMNETVWLRLLAALPAGLSEVMVHPGYSGADEDEDDMGRGWLGDSRQTELEALLSPRVSRRIRSDGIELVNFRVLAAA